MAIGDDFNGPGRSEPAPARPHEPFQKTFFFEKGSWCRRAAAGRAAGGAARGPTRNTSPDRAPRTSHKLVAAASLAAGDDPRGQGGHRETARAVRDRAKLRREARAKKRGDDPGKPRGARKAPWRPPPASTPWTRASRPRRGVWRASPAGSGWRTRPPSTPWRRCGGSRRPCFLGSNLRTATPNECRTRCPRCSPTSSRASRLSNRPPEGKGIAWRGTVPPQKWMNFSTKVLSRFAATPGLKLRGVVRGAAGRESDRGEAGGDEGVLARSGAGGGPRPAVDRPGGPGRGVAPPALLNLPTGSTSGGTARPQGLGGVARTGPGCRRGRRGNRDRSTIEFSGTARADPLAGVWRSGT